MCVGILLSVFVLYLQCHWLTIAAQKGTLNSYDKIEVRCSLIYITAPRRTERRLSQVITLNIALTDRVTYVVTGPLWHQICIDTGLIYGFRISCEAEGTNFAVIVQHTLRCLSGAFPRTDVNLQLQEMKEQKQQEQQLTDMEQRLVNCQEQLRERDLREATNLREQLREKEQQQENSQRELTEMQQRLANYKGQVQERDLRETNLREQLREKERQQESLQRQRAEMEQQLRDMEQRLANCQEQLHEKDLGEANLREQLRVKEQEMNELELSLTAARTLSQQRQQETCDWVISRNQIQVTDKCLGRGGWAIVNEGTYCGCSVAVKQMHQLILSPYNRGLFEREMNIASRCRHPCLLQFIGATNDERSPLFVTELMETSLRALLKQRGLSETEIRAISLDVTLALNYLHQKKPSPIIHRDVSSGNVLLWRHGDQWRGKLSDYGTAKFVQQTMTVAPGTPIYSAPEALSSSQTAMVDVYSFGVLLCEMCIRE